MQRVTLLSPTLHYERQVVSRDQLKWLPGRLSLDITVSETDVDAIGAESENRLRESNYSPYQLQLITLQTNTQNNLHFLMLCQLFMQFG